MEPEADSPHFLCTRMKTTTTTTMMKMMMMMMMMRPMDAANESEEDGEVDGEAEARTQRPAAVNIDDAAEVYARGRAAACAREMRAVRRRGDVVSALFVKPRCSK